MQEALDEQVGIDGMAVYIPRLYIDLRSEWALSRAGAAEAVDDLVQKLTKGIGVRRMAIPDAHEDSATMAAMAASRLIDRLALDPSKLGYLAIGTETTVDQSKSIGAYVLGMLQRRYAVDLSHVGCPQFQFACIGATYALEAAVALIRAGELGDRYAIVVATDVSRYPLRSSAECTQGAGAVAMCVARRPRLLALSRTLRATVAVDERDFFRPNWSSDAVVDGQHSLQVYADCLDSLLATTIRGDGRAARALAATDYFLFHTPFPRMAEYAASRLFRRLPQLHSLTPWVRGDPSIERSLDRQIPASEPFRAWFDRTCAPAVAHAAEVGNLYSGSLYLALATLAEHVAALPADKREASVALFSYGSGASAKLLHGILRVPPGSDRGGHLTEDLKDADPEGGPGRVPLSLAEYERLHQCERPSGRDGVPAILPSVRAATAEFALVRFGTERTAAKTDLGYRYYTYVP